MELTVQRSKQGMVERISKIIQVKKLSASRFADILGVPRSTISHILSGRNNPSLEFIQKVLSAFPEVRVAWLMRGEEPMFISTNTLFSEVEYDDPPPGRTKDSNRPDSGSGSQSGNGGDVKQAVGAKVQSDTSAVGRLEEGNKRQVETGAAPEQKAPADIPHHPTIKTGIASPGPLPDLAAGETAGPAGGRRHQLEPSPGRLTKAGGKKAVKVVFFYEDGTFSEFTPE